MIITIVPIYYSIALLGPTIKGNGIKCQTVDSEIYSVSLF